MKRIFLLLSLISAITMNYSCQQEQSVEIFAENAAGAKIGDRVLLSSSGANVLLLSLFVFFIPNT